tara:strand:- start:1408 stop:1746 length:339 start_codon:yes stop_codon:yes gene_type:complete
VTLIISSIARYKEITSRSGLKIEIINYPSMVEAIHESSLPLGNDTEMIRKHRRKMLLPKIVGWYKMNVSKQITEIRNTTGQKLWQRNYYDHIIRNEQSLHQIRGYIRQNHKK